MKNINKRKLVKEIKRLNALIIQHKGNIRRPHITGYVSGEPILAESRKIDGKNFGICYSQYELISLKSKVTILCSLRASMRCKIHMNGKTLEEQEQFLKDNIKMWLQFEDLEAAA